MGTDTRGAGELTATEALTLCRRLAAEFVRRVAAAAFEAEELELGIAAARDALDGIRSPATHLGRVPGGRPDPDAMAEGLHRVAAMESRLEEKRREEAELARLFANVRSELSPSAAACADAMLEEEALGMRSTYEENIRRLKRRRREERGTSALQRSARESATSAEIAAQLIRRGIASPADLEARL